MMKVKREVNRGMRKLFKKNAKKAALKFNSRKDYRAAREYFVSKNTDLPLDVRFQMAACGVVNGAFIK